jgi:outer membrane protein assembly factor BamD
VRRALLPCALALALVACGNRDPDIATLASNSDELIWQEGQKALQKKLWDNARQHFKRIIEGFPQSEFGPSARLALGDAYFKEGGTASYILAVSAYRDFLTLYPSHPRADYAQLQVAEAFLKQSNPPDRDQTPTRKALDEYQRLLEFYPQSSYVENTRQRVAECRQRLARHEFLVGSFYQRTRRACKAAIARYEVVLADFPDYAGTDEVLLRLGQCLAQSGRGAEALPRLARLLQDFPQSSFAEDARALMQTVATAVPTAPSPAPADAPSPAPSGR